MKIVLPWDGLARKAACCRAWWSEFDLQDPCGERRDRINSCGLFWPPHKCVHECEDIISVITKFKINRFIFGSIGKFLWGLESGSHIKDLWWCYLGLSPMALRAPCVHLFPAQTWWPLSCLLFVLPFRVSVLVAWLLPGSPVLPRPSLSHLPALPHLRTGNLAVGNCSGKPVGSMVLIQLPLKAAAKETGWAGRLALRFEFFNVS